MLRKIYLLVLFYFILSFANSCVKVDASFFREFDDVLHYPIEKNLYLLLESNVTNISEFEFISYDSSIIDSALNVYRTNSDQFVKLKITHTSKKFKIYDLFVPKVDSDYYVSPLYIHFIYVGQGDAILIELPNNK